MRKILSCILVSLILFLLSSCSMNNIIGGFWGRFTVTDRQVSNEKFDKIINAIKNKDSNTLKTTFSKNTLNTVDSIDADISDLFTLFCGDIETIDDYAGPTVDNLKEDGKVKKTYESTYDVITTEYLYRFHIVNVIIDEFDPDNVGIYSLCIIRKNKDANTQYAYWSDANSEPGVHIDMESM